MHRLLDSEQPWMRFLSTCFDLILLNILFLISCIPIVTIGAALTALNGVTIQMADRRDPSVLSAYWGIFKKKMKQATSIWIILLLLALFLGTDLYIITHYLDPAYFFCFYPVVFLVLVLLSMQLYLYPMMASYELKTKILIKNALLLALGHLPTTILLLLLIGILILIYNLTNAVALLMLSLFMFIGLAALSLIISKRMLRIFKKHSDLPDA